MPQMAPMLWLPLFLTMTLIIIWVKSNSFFLLSMKTSLTTEISDKPKTITWQW